MSKALLICPSERPAVAELSRLAPLAAVPLLGQSLLEYWLTHLALGGFKEVHILADDRAEQISKLAGSGARWGLKVEVTTEVRELTAAQAQIKYAAELPVSGPSAIAVMEHFPGEPDCPLFTSYSNFFAGLARWMPKAKTIDRVGVREVQPGIWLGRHAHVSPDAQLHAPCWIGQNAIVGAHCVIGPMAVLEDRSFVEGGAEIVNSIIGPDTFVGKLAALRRSLALGNMLINWQTNSIAQISDAFLMCALRRQANAKTSEKFLHRLFELLFSEPEPEVSPLDSDPLDINQQGKFT
jgi:NDP-sugar pyrophosphorylase family protein